VYEYQPSPERMGSHAERALENRLDEETERDFGSRTKPSLRLTTCRHRLDPETTKIDFFYFSRCNC
jgi:hypothetical protein